MPEAILQTKLHIPLLRPLLVPRPQLVEKLNAGLDGKLTLVSAAAGFGKTTIISDWVHQLERPVAWLSLDKGDNDPTRFWNYAFAALQGARAELGEDVFAALGSPQPPPIEALLTNLTNQVTALSDKVILALDDYHVIKNQEIHQAITFLLDHLPSQLHLVLVSRSDPPLNLARIRGQGQLSELREADLRFTAEETNVFLLQTVDLQLSCDVFPTMNSCIRPAKLMNAAARTSILFGPLSRLFLACLMRSTYRTISSCHWK